jgi:hypothetical protein
MRLIFIAFLMGIALTGCSNDAEQNRASAKEEIGVDTEAAPEDFTDLQFTDLQFTDLQFKDLQGVTAKAAEDQQQPRRPLDLSLPDDIGVEQWNTDELYNVRSNLFDAKELFKKNKEEDPVIVYMTPSFYDNDVMPDGASISVEVKTK